MILFVFFSCNMNTKKISNTTIEFESDIYDYGVISFDKSISTVFSFINSGNHPLLIKAVKTSCGCTITEWDNELIMPNQKGELLVNYDAKNLGHFRSSIIIFYNGVNSPKKIFIKGEVDYLSLLK